MYQEHFGLRESPFSLTPDTSFFFACSNYQEGLNTLLVAARTGAILCPVDDALQQGLIQGHQRALVFAQVGQRHPAGEAACPGLEWTRRIKPFPRPGDFERHVRERVFGQERIAHDGLHVSLEHRAVRQHAPKGLFLELSRITHY